MRVGRELDYGVMGLTCTSRDDDCKGPLQWMTRTRIAGLQTWTETGTIAVVHELRSSGKSRRSTQQVGKYLSSTIIGREYARDGCGAPGALGPHGSISWQLGKARLPPSKYG
jgi:hypothetical protein